MADIRLSILKYMEYLDETVNSKEMAVTPKFAETPLELLENNGDRELSVLSKIWAPTVCGGLGFIAVITGNWFTRRPYFSGIQKHIIASLGFAGIGKVIDDYRSQYLADRDAIFRHYIQLHPEDFPPYERKKVCRCLGALDSYSLNCKFILVK
ncbi:hypothetical protein NQ318_021742 [Aromia moschata]|uniref:NADH dehydrogenase [ubiquinone] 1 subunit C2 n=1 Tax=Aromia moschata TaxID=1265417 RepID=A0AAV8XYJ8_9CUCU|nr:hypothetical protein NQ318_021742 [Aromia moschata]